MKRILIIFTIFANCNLLFAQSSMSDLYKQWMIEDINNGRFDKAINEIVYIDNWSFNFSNKKDFINIRAALQFIQYADSINLSNSLIEKLSLYICTECEYIWEYFYEMHDYNTAIFYCEILVTLHQNILGESHPDYANSLNSLGLLYFQMGDYQKAEKLYLNALSIWKNTLDVNHPNFATSFNNIGLLYYQLGEFAKAEKYFLDALEVREKVFGTEHKEYANSLNALGALYAQIGDFQRAEQYYSLALNIQGTTLGGNSYEYALSLLNLGTLHFYCNDYIKAERYYLEALQIIKDNRGENNPDYCKCINYLGSLYGKKGNYQKAEQCILESLHTRETMLGKNNPDYASSLNSLGNIYYQMGDFQKAETYYIDALNIWKAVFGENHPYCAHCLNNLGANCCMMNKYEEAETYFSTALKIRESIYDTYIFDYAISLHSLGILNSLLDNYKQAESYYFNSQNIFKKLFINSVDYMLESERTSYWDKFNFNFEYIYPLFIYKYRTKAPLIRVFSYDNELFFKGLQLLSTETVRVSILDSNDTTLINQWNTLTQEKQIIAAMQEKDPQSPYIAQHQQRADSLEKVLTINSAAFRQSREQWNVTWDSVRNHLTDTQVAIEYFTAPLNEDSTMYCALLLRKDSEYPELIPLFEEKEALALINTTTPNFTNRTYGFHVADEDEAEASDGAINIGDTLYNGARLKDLVWSKVLPYIREGETIYFAPSGLLHQLAIEALPYDTKRTMADVYNLVRLSSTRELVLRRQQPSHTTATLYGGIQYNMDGDEMLVESEQYATQNLLASRGIESDTLNRGTVNYLQGTKQEVENINQMLRESNLKVQLFTATNANEESFKALSGKHQNILHIATHGFFWTDSTAQRKDYFSQRMLMMDGNMSAPPTIDPLNRCGLLFAGANTALTGRSSELPEGVQDGILTAKEISLLDLRDADLVVLSACETGKGEITGEGVFGLQRAFKQAGAQTIIMSLWPVNDQATQLLMTEFYKNWIANHQSKRTAFRNAQNTVRKTYEEPAYWAGFIMLD